MPPTHIQSKNMCTFCPIRKPPLKKAVRFDSYVDTFSISDASGHKVIKNISVMRRELPTYHKILANDKSYGLTAKATYIRLRLYKYVANTLTNGGNDSWQGNDTDQITKCPELCALSGQTNINREINISAAVIARLILNETFGCFRYGALDPFTANSERIELLIATRLALISFKSSSFPVYSDVK
ncbi:hypothetical protein HUJ04_009876 [Dendroctonus ponderosae]|nr:hypothetical protein HUJ04_009876 [Dendroctonus ponderosae]